MQNRTRLRISVEDTMKTRHYWATRPGIDDETVEKLLSSEILIVPWENRSGVTDTFPQGTTEFVRRISKGCKQFPIAMAIEPRNYQELSLHSNHVRWPRMVVTTIALGVISSVLGNEISALLNQPNPPQTIDMELIVEKSGRECVAIRYEGPPLRAIETLVEEAKACFPEDIDLAPPELTVPNSESNGNDSEQQ